MKYLFMGLVSLMALRISAMEKQTGPTLNTQSYEPVQIVFDNHPHDTVISLNGGMLTIKPGEKNVTATSVKKVEIKLLDGALLNQWLLHELQKVKRITVTQGKKSGEYVIIEEPACP